MAARMPTALNLDPMLHTPKSACRVRVMHAQRRWLPAWSCCASKWRPWRLSSGAAAPPHDPIHRWGLLCHGVRVDAQMVKKFEIDAQVGLALPQRRVRKST